MGVSVSIRERGETTPADPIVIVIPEQLTHRSLRNLVKVNFINLLTRATTVDTGMQTDGYRDIR